MTAEEIDGQWWTIPAARAKNGIASRVWLTKEALALTGFEPITRANVSKALYRLKTDDLIMGIPSFVAEDMRRSMSTQLAQIGIGDEVIDSILNHAKKGIIKVYNVYKYDNEKKDALEKWGKKLMDYLGGKSGKIIQMKSIPTDEFMTMRSSNVA